MTRISLSSVQFCVYSLLSLPHQAMGSTPQSAVLSQGAPTETAAWTSSSVRHLYGLPGAKAKDKGTLSVNRMTLNFASRGSAATVPVESILAVSTGSERVGLWGLKGRLLRMAIPNGGGWAAAAVMHHKVNMLTVEFNDSNGGYHSAVFFLLADEAANAVQSIAVVPVHHREPAVASCTAGNGEPGTVRVLVPKSDQVDVPAAYRGLVYERLIDRLHRSKGIRAVYRDGEMNADHKCPQYTINLSITGFKPGSQVKRTMMGPAGMFVGTTQMAFDLKVTGSDAGQDYRAQVKATVRGDSESMNVADAVAKKIVKQFTARRRDANGNPTRTN